MNQEKNPKNALICHSIEGPDIIGCANELINLFPSENCSTGSAPVDISLISPLTMAFIGGYSFDILLSIMNRFIFAVTNDERYLPASEIMKRKSDIRKISH
ncbi:hypothetical protein PITCH_A350019 [uncultured Desulfobacterium sp.]|uniref:Uncharacterized protein n=1 Tax=uncultured Desulfobacterium sp. TaxID=201089 RepID=A0A445MZ83_9BACT|nr:hypothetical protein PITCH_A350019 [uncultured Desulfobacterium sp.]